MDKVIGIDLGTFNSCVAIVENGVPTVIANRGGYKTTPSMVAVTEAGKRLVGHIAKRQAVTNAENTVYAAKRFIGRKFSSPQVQGALATASYRIVEGPHNDPRLQLRDRAYSVPEISAMVLQEMKMIAEDYLGSEVQKVVVTVPAYFNDGQRQATKDAGSIAGLDVIRIINEPTAAALAYGHGKDLDQTVAVFDLGGGTFDISILEIGSGGVFKVVSTAGDTFLGGEDFDQRILDWLIDRFAQEYGMDLRQDRMALQRLKDASEKAKCELSHVLETEINLPFIISDAKGEPLHLQSLLSRQKLEELTRDLVERTVDITKSALEEAQMKPSDIEEVILVGGMTRMPVVQQTVARFFGKEPNKGVHPDEVVALGASIQGHSLLDDTASNMILLDVTPHTLGIMVAEGGVEELIPQNSTVPTSKSKVFTTSKDNQTAVKILVVQGESEQAQENDIIGEFVLSGLRRALAYQVEIEVTFDINADGIVSVFAKDLETGKEQSITVTASSGLTKDEVSNMIEHAKEFSVTTKQSDEVEKARQNVQLLVDEIEKIFPKVADSVKGSDFGKDALEKAKAVIEKAKMSLKGTNVDELQEHADALGRTHRMFKGVLGTK